MKRLAKAYYIDLPFGDHKPFWALEWHVYDSSELMRPQFKSASFNSYEEMMVFADLNEIEVMQVLKHWSKAETSRLMKR